MPKYKRPIKKSNRKKPTIPIKDPKEINLMMNYLLKEIYKAKSEKKKKQKRRNWMLVLLGFNTAYRAEDLIQLRVKDVNKGYQSIVENKTGKVHNYRMNKNLYADILDYIEKNELDEYDYLFGTQKNKGLTPMTRQQCDRLLRDIANAIKLKQPFSAHSMRKTFAYQLYLNGTDLITISKMLNHFSVEETLIYICWGDDDVASVRQKTYIGGTHRKK